MKLLKMRIARDQTAKGTHYVYPKEYNAHKVRFGPFYESSLPENYDKVVARGNVDEHILFGVDDADAPAFLQCPDTQELSYDEALGLGNAWTKQVEKISDPNRVLAIVAEVARGETLTSDEKKALNPDDPSSGITKGKAFKDSLDDALAR